MPQDVASNILWHGKFTNYSSFITQQRAVFYTNDKTQKVHQEQMAIFVSHRHDLCYDNLILIHALMHFLG